MAEREYTAEELQEMAEEEQRRVEEEEHQAKSREYHSLPQKCICEHTSFTKREETKMVDRYTCCKCGRNYPVHHARPKADVLLDGTILDYSSFGLGSREISHRLFVDRGIKRTHPVILHRIERNVEILRTFTGDILCTLQYGDEWDIDETHIPTRLEKSKPKGLAEFDTGQRHRKTRMESGVWLTGVLDRATRVIIAYITTRYKPDKHDMYGLIMQAVTVGGIPSVITTDGYDAYVDAIEMLKQQINNELRGDVRHVVGKKPKQFGYRRLRSKKRRRGRRGTPEDKKRKKEGRQPPHNNVIESAWRSIKHELYVGKTRSDSVENMIHYAIMYYNFIRPHSSHHKVGLLWRRKFAWVYKTPVMRAGYSAWFPNFEMLLGQAKGYEKAFLAGMTPEARKMVSLSFDGVGIVLWVSPESDINDDVLDALDRMLQTEYGFIQRNEWWEITKEDGSPDAVRLPAWWKKMPVLYEMVSLRGHNLWDRPNHDAFAICTECGRLASTPQQVQELFGIKGRRAYEKCCSCRRVLTTGWGTRWRKYQIFGFQDKFMWEARADDYDW